MPGFIIYRGPSVLDGEPIVVVAVTTSANQKTGNVVQTHILVDNGRSPQENVKSLKDVSVCGDCPLRQGIGGACYANVFQGPNMVHKTLMRGGYEESIEKAARACRGRVVRLGSYGDPAAVPISVWHTLLKESKGHLGYTHQWTTCPPEFRDLCLASVETEEGRDLAKKMGYRTFRVRTEGLLKGEIVCPASEEGGKKTHCEDCGLCHGGKGKDVTIVVHGRFKGRMR